MASLVKERSLTFDRLVDFCRCAGLSLPSVEKIAGASMPEPYRSLLVHDRDMTPTLEEFWGETIHLQPLQVREADGVLFREVTLVTDLTGLRTEFGGIKISLEHFSDAARSKILAGEVPLGRILGDLRIRHKSQPIGFFSFAGDQATRDALAVDPGCTLFGRHTVLHADGRLLAEVVEILPPIKGRTVTGNF